MQITIIAIFCYVEDFLKAIFWNDGQEEGAIQQEVRI